ncbi:SUMF1/EgtB/PvdO family nonheme iron enzyme [Devosia sp.]|uniref:SUMF1/EgtB/PvdO family nonheme iron enzyme n=1 Tax=Devosia sp. TaxID=1871048 RepID=UPI002AFE2A1C|nr:SUMF1/EgtB/PvdO family nonheme iron enzyme [Devosia sp.]
MIARADDFRDMAGIALPALLLAAGLAVMATQLVPLHVPQPVTATASVTPPQTVTLPPGTLTYRAPGQFLRDGAPVDAPMATIAFDAPFEMMTYQVSAADYARCVNDGACAPAAPRHQGVGDVPVTGVNFDDATDYAQWLSAATGETWVLPTDAQWAYAAGSRFVDDALNIAENNANPALRWLANYEKEAARQSAAQPMPRVLGAFGANENGLMDMAGNVWEWTQTCNAHVHIDAAGAVLSQLPACTIRVLEGQHRTPMSVFIRDARSGGCSVGVPPDNLGFRLVRQAEPNWFERLAARLGF